MKDYTIRAEPFRELVDSIGVGEPIIDSFATLFNTLCEKILGLQSDSLSQSWTGQGLLWINPPFSLMDKVVSKIESEQVEFFCCAPNGQQHYGRKHCKL